MFDLKGENMTKTEAIRILKINQSLGDTEASHSNADDVLCDFLIGLGHQDLVDEWRKVPKWYA